MAGSRHSASTASIGECTPSNLVTTWARVWDVASYPVQYPLLNQGGPMRNCATGINTGVADAPTLPHQAQTWTKPLGYWQRENSELRGETSGWPANQGWDRSVDVRWPSGFCADQGSKCALHIYRAKGNHPHNSFPFIDSANPTTGQSQLSTVLTRTDTFLQGLAPIDW